MIIKQRKKEAGNNKNPSYYIYLAATTIWTSNY